MLVRLPAGHSAQSVGDALIGAFTTLPTALRRTLTWDQGNEMFHHERIEQATGLQIYFADPHSPWQRGSNENTNGLLRQYFPKGTDLQIWTAEQLALVAAELNDRPGSALTTRHPASSCDDGTASRQHRNSRRWLETKPGPAAGTATRPGLPAPGR
jgi:IS30 family transposase